MKKSQFKKLKHHLEQEFDCIFIREKGQYKIFSVDGEFIGHSLGDIRSYYIEYGKVEKAWETRAVLKQVLGI